MPEHCDASAEPLDRRADPAELAAECDAYAAEARTLHRQLADADTREQFHNTTINRLRAELDAHHTQPA